MFEDKWGSQIGGWIDSVAYGDPCLNAFVAFDFLILAKRTSGSDPEWDWWYSDDICAGAAQERWEKGNETQFYKYDIRLVTKIE